MEEEFLHLENVQEVIDLGRKSIAFEELEILLPIIRRAIESGDTSELEEWAR